MISLLEKELRKILKKLYVQACLDCMSKEYGGKGKEICEDRINQVIPKLYKQISKIIREFKTGGQE